MRRCKWSQLVCSSEQQHFSMLSVRRLRFDDNEVLGTTPKLMVSEPELTAMRSNAGEFFEARRSESKVDTFSSGGYRVWDFQNSVVDRKSRGICLV